MASKFKGIRDQLITDLQTTTITKAYTSPPTQKPVDPYCEIALVKAEVDSPGESIDDYTHELTVWITSREEEEVQIALEEVYLLWRNQAKISALNALGVIDINPTNSDPGIKYARNAEVVGTAVFDVVIRYPY